MMCAITEYIMSWWPYTFICASHYPIIIIIQTYLKVMNCWSACQIHSVSSVCLRLGQSSQLSFMQYMGLCVFSLPIYLVMIVRINVLDSIIFIKSEVWPMRHYFRIKSWNNGMRCMPFSILIHSIEIRSMVDPQYCIEGPSQICTQSAEVRLAVSGEKALFNLGLAMFAWSLVDFLFMQWSPSTNIEIFYFCQ